MRKSISRKASNRIFRRTALRVRKANLIGHSMRGGLRF